MAYNSFYLNLLFRVVLFGITNLGFFYLLVARERFFSMIFLGILGIVQILLLIHYVNTTNRNLARFLLLLGEEDTEVISLKEKVEKTFQGLHYSFQRLNKEINLTRMEKEYATIRLKKIVDHLMVGILVWNNDRVVEVVNAAGLTITGLTQIKQLEELDKVQPRLSERIRKLNPGKKVIIKIKNPWGERKNLLFKSSRMLLGKTTLSMVSFQDIQAELEEQEIESWQKLIRVLIHEVSNSVTPISTLGTNIKNRVSSFPASVDEEVKIPLPVAEDIQRSAELIEQRGNGLLEFVQGYKNLIRLPEPEKKPVALKVLIEDICSLCTRTMDDSPVKIIHKVEPPDLILHIDRKMIEQVLINLIRNAIDAMTEIPDKIIRVEAGLFGNNIVQLRIIDEGTGIPADIIDKIFIPFFTTKRKGSGIGLSLSRRILQLHGGTIHLHSEPGKGTSVTLTIPV